MIQLITPLCSSTAVSFWGTMLLQVLPAYCSSSPEYLATEPPPGKSSLWTRHLEKPWIKFCKWASFSPPPTLTSFGQLRKFLFPSCLPLYSTFPSYPLPSFLLPFSLLYFLVKLSGNHLPLQVVNMVSRYDGPIAIFFSLNLPRKSERGHFHHYQWEMHHFRKSLKLSPLGTSSWNARGKNNEFIEALVSTHLEHSPCLPACMISWGE